MTHTAKHTLGPWFYNYDDRCITNQDGVTVINVHGAMSGDNTSADIAMIAAAPVMYEALKAAYKLLREWTPSGEDNQGEVEGLIEAALAQAEGK